MISNAMSHHQKSLCDYLSSIDSVEFRFVATKPLTQERQNMGYSDLNYSADYIIRSYENDESYNTAMDLANNSDFVIYGSAPYEFVKDRIKNNKWTFIYSERIFKKKEDKFYNLKLFLIYYLRFGRFSNKRIKVLCASAYAAGDFHKFGFKQQQLYKWGYFPKQSETELNKLLSMKKERSILWVARMISWKHPETVVNLANRLKSENVPFSMTIVGNGALFDDIKSKVEQSGLSDYVTLTGALSTLKVRELMEQSEVYVTTSDQNEGWGAVINEAMSSACAVCACKEMGSAPFLINNNANGYLFDYKDDDTLYKQVHDLLNDDNKRKSCAENAYFTIGNKWNYKIAADRLVDICQHINDNDTDYSFPEGICSIADINTKC